MTCRVRKTSDNDSELVKKTEDWMKIFVSLSDDPLSDFYMGEEACNFVESLGFSYVCPVHELALTHSYAHSEGRNEMIAIGTELMPTCDEVWIFGDRLGGISFIEKKTAISLGKKIKRISSVHMRSKVIPKEYI